jgi:hypothetical protein
VPKWSNEPEVSFGSARHSPDDHEQLPTVTSVAAANS